jgi:hypothetical protein
MTTNDLQNIALNRFLDFYKNDIESEVIDASNVVLSFPVHFSGFHRIEITVTQSSPDQFIISDGAKTIDELRMAGYTLTSKLRKRLEMVSAAAKIRVVNDYLVCDSNLANLGSSIQRFLEAAKTIGDAYLVQRATLNRETDLINQVTAFLATQQVPYQTRHPLLGEYERHVVDFYFPPNGVPGLALSVMNNPSRTVAEAWAFRSQDIKKTNQRVQVGVVYDDQDVRDNSKSILNGVLDVSIPSSDIPALHRSLQTIGILKGA